MAGTPASMRAASKAAGSPRGTSSSGQPVVPAVAITSKAREPGHVTGTAMIQPALRASPRSFGGRRAGSSCEPGKARRPSGPPDLETAKGPALELGLHAQSEAPQPLLPALAVTGLGVEQHDLVGEHRGAAVAPRPCPGERGRASRRSDADDRAPPGPGSLGPGARRVRPDLSRPRRRARSRARSTASLMQA